MTKNTSDTSCIRISFLMICYKQEKYIAKALESALAQIGDPIEIVVSDDHSPDRTFEIASSIAANYHGPHKIILNQNPTNLGIGANFQRAAELAGGEWLLMAAGDDIFLPDRAEITRAAVRKHPKALGFGAPREFIDSEDRSLGYSDWHKLIHGASAAWHRRLFTEFPPIPDSVGSEDGLLYFRILLLNGEAVILNRPVLRYRNDGLTNRCQESYRTSLPQSLHKTKINAGVLEQRLKECSLPSLHIQEEQRRQLIDLQQKHLDKLKAKIDKLIIKVSWISMGLGGFWKNYLCGRLTPRPPWWKMLGFSLYFFQHPTHKLLKEVPQREDIVITLERYLREPHICDF